MAIARANRLSAHAAYLIRPALAEARLITAKRARDAVYVATLDEELRNIERIIDKLEENLDLGALAAPAKDAIVLASRDLEIVKRIRAKSCELEQRLRRIEQSASDEDLAWPGCSAIASQPIQSYQAEQRF